MRFLTFGSTILICAIAFAQAPNTSDSSTLRIVGGTVATVNGETKACMLIQGMSFPVNSLKTIGSLPQPLTITIRGYDKDKKVLLVTGDSIVPTGEPVPGKSLEYFTQASNVVWQFSKAGISFVTADGTYVANKDGATISFTDKGVQMDGVALANSNSTTEPASQPDATTRAKADAAAAADKLCKDAASFLDQDKTQDASDAFEKAIAIAPRRGETWLALADSKLYPRRAQPDVWDALIKAHPDSPFPRAFKASSFYGWGKLAEADAELAAAEKFGPEDPLVWSFCFQIHALEGRYDDAVSDHDKYTKYGGFKPLEGVGNYFGLLLA